MKTGMQAFSDPVTFLEVLVDDGVYIFGLYSAIPGIVWHDANGRTRATLPHTATFCYQNLARLVVLETGKYLLRPVPLAGAVLTNLY
jgi:hypothetical protein